MDNQLKKLAAKAQLLCIYKNAVISSKISKLIDAISGESIDFDALTDYVSALYAHNGSGNTTAYFKTIIIEDENAFSTLAALGETLSPNLKNAVKNELAILEELSGISKQTLGIDGIAEFGARGVLPSANELCDLHKTRGYGVISRGYVYTYSGGNFKVIKNPNLIKLSDLKDYEDEKKVAIENTEFFVKGLPYNNVLLYGDRGTGKSSTVHALINQYKDSGLRLLEVGKNEICHFEKIIGYLSKFSLKFIIFIDDLTFVEGADDYAQLKAALEGSVSKISNAAIYATTNRRHLLKENAADRVGDDMRANDTREEQLSLSDRFGLVITFINPAKREFISILRQILCDRKITLPPETLELAAERYAMSKGGRSPRAAKQLADMIESKIKLNKPILEI